MEIEHDLFVNWVEEKFPNVQISGNEVKINDIWWKDEFGNPDTKNHCWVNTEKGCFRAFKSETTGNIIELIMEVDGCSWEEARDIIGASKLRRLEQKVIEFIKTKKPKKVIKNLELPIGTFLIKSLPYEHPLRVKAEKYLKNRKLEVGNLMVCMEGRYRNRIIIPYYSEENELIYFNARDITGQSKIKYMGPSKECNVGKSDVLWMSGHPAYGSKIYVTEGEFDAMILKKCGFHSCACGGKSISSKQIEVLRPYHVIMSYDADKAGEDGFKIASWLMKSGIKKIGFIRPPKGFKDWNELFLKSNIDIIQKYIRINEREFNEFEYNLLRVKA